MMKKFLLARGNSLAFLLVAGLMLALATSVPVNSQNPQGPAQSDHALFGPGDTAVFCGVARVGNQAEPYTLHVAASNPTASGVALTIAFRDGDSIGFEIPASSSFSTTQELGGVPDVDDIVQVIPASGGSAMVSAKVRAGAKDPFANDDEQDNFCVTAPGDPGSNGDGTDFTFLVP